MYVYMFSLGITGKKTMCIYGNISVYKRMHVYTVYVYMFSLGITGKKTSV